MTHVHKVQKDREENELSNCSPHQSEKYQPNATLCTQKTAKISRGLRARGPAGPEDDNLDRRKRTMSDDQKPGEHHLYMLIEELLGFVDLCGQVWAAAAIGVVEQHELAVLLGELVPSQSALTIGSRKGKLAGRSQ